MKNWLIIGVLLAASVALYFIPFPWQSDTGSVGLEYRLVFVGRSLGEDGEVDEFRDIARRASQHGYTGVVFASMFDRITLQDPEYFRRLGEIKSICDRYRLDIFPVVCSAGYGGGLLQHDRNLAAAVPVRDALYIVRDGAARVFQPRRARILNGSFEQARGDRVEDFDLQDGPGAVTHVDGDVVRDGKVSLRLDNLDRARHGMGRIMQAFDVEPFHSYRVSCWMRAEDLEPAVGAVQVQVRTVDGHILNNWNPTLPESGDWRHVVTGFNSLQHTRVRVYAGVWEGKRGRLWIDGLDVEEAGPINILRRQGTPVLVTAQHTVAGDDGARPAEGTPVVYEEGRDFERIADANIDFRFDHRDPLIRIPPESRIHEGDLLRISYYQGFAINQYQVPVCIAEPEVYRLWRESLEMIHDVLRPAGYFLSMDELRAGGWCESCRKDGLTAAERLGRCITKQRAIIRELDPGAKVFIWSDMLDPNHNAVEDYYLYKGDFRGSWNHVPRDLIIACWYYDRRKASLQHFEKLGFRTVAGAYYDADTLDEVQDWLDALADTQGSCGIIYTTWYNKYLLLESFGDLVIGRK